MEGKKMSYLQNVKFHFDHVHKWAPLHFGPILLHQVGDLISDQDFENGLHTQECYELTYMASGRGTCFTRGKYYDVHQGDVFILRTGDLHNIKSDNEAPLRFFYCGFDFDEADPRMSVFRPLQELLNTTEMPLASDKFNMYTIFTNIFNEYMSRNAMRETVLETLLIELLCALYRDFVEVTKVNYAPSERRPSSESLFYSIVQYMEQNIIGIRQLKEVSDHFGYAYSYISHIFSQNLNKTLKEYYNDLKISKAREFLDHNMSVTEVSDMLGYTSIHSFSRFFRQQYGLSPTEYKQKSQRKWVQTFYDDFDGDTLDGSKWFLCPEYEHDDGTRWRYSQTRLEDGLLKLSIHKEENSYGAGAVYTVNNFDQKGGYFEIRCRLQTVPGWWLSFGLKHYPEKEPDPNSDELRELRLEVLNSAPMSNSSVAHTISWTDTGGNPCHVKKIVTDPELFQGMHTYGVEWTESQFIFYIDRKETWRTSVGRYTKPLFMQVTTQTAPWAELDDSRLPDHVEVEYVKAYLLK